MSNLIPIGSSLMKEYEEALREKVKFILKAAKWITSWIGQTILKTIEAQVGEELQDDSFLESSGYISEPSEGKAIIHNLDLEEDEMSLMKRPMTTRQLEKIIG